MEFRLHALEMASRANGPGLRAVLWFQGCTLDCPGCFNPATHDAAGGFQTDTTVVAARLLSKPNGIEGVSFSGGEPFQQPEALLDLLERMAGAGLSTLVFSGYALNEIQSQPLGPAILSRLDVLIAGRYVQSLHLGRGLLGSSNQQIHLLTGRYTPADVQSVPVWEVILHADGAATLSGFWGHGQDLLSARREDKGPTQRR
jgi:anaerobic ribonucleoside-triphosphate reductase activating protein